MSLPPGLPAVTWTPEAMQAYCRRFGVSPAEFAAQLAEENAQIARDWEDFRRRRPDGSLRSFALEQIEATALELLTTSGVPIGRARTLARNARRIAEERAP
jgi:hypothetical protein